MSARSSAIFYLPDQEVAREVAPDGVVLSLVGGFLTLLWAALLLAEVGWFTGWLPPAAGVGVALVLWRGHRRTSGGARRVPAGALAAAALAAGVAAVSIPPGEMILGGSDPGVYVHTAAGLVRHRSLSLPAEDLAALSRQERRLLTRDVGSTRQPFAGFLLRPDGRLSPSFHHLYPALLAVAMSLAGVWGALLVNALLAALSVLAVYALARRFVPPPWAVGAPLALALSPALLWQAKFPASELLAQVLLTTGAVLLIDTLDGAAPRPRVPLLAGACLGLSLLARYDSLLVLIPLTFILALLATDAGRRRRVLLVLAPLSLLAAQSFLHGRLIAVYYAPLKRPLLATLGAAVVLLACVLAVRRTRAGGAAEAWLAPRAPTLRCALAGSVVGWALLAWVVRPRLADAEGIFAAFARLLRAAGGESLFRVLAGPERYDFIYLRDILGAPGLVVALAGVALAVCGSRTAGRLAWALPAIVPLLLFGSNVLHDHALMWVLRRFVPVVLPLLAVAVALAAAWAAARMRRFGRRPEVMAGVAVLLLALLPNLGASAAMARAREWPGLVRWCRDLAAAVPPGAAVFSDVPGLAAPLRFLHGVRAYEYNHGRRTRDSQFFGLLGRRASRGEAVYLLTRAQPRRDDGLVLREAGRFPLHTRAVGSQFHGIPRRSVPRDLDLVLYRVEPAGRAAAGG